MRQTYVAYRRETGEPVEFEVDWPAEEDAQQTWRWDAEHNAFPVTPLSAEFNRGRTGPAFTMRGSGQAINVHGYRYSPARLGGPGGPFSLADDPERAAQLERIDQLWDRGWRRTIETEADEVYDTNFDAMSVGEIVAQMREIGPRVGHHAELMFRALDIVGYGRGRLTEFCRQALGQEDFEAVVSDLLGGYTNPTLEANAALWDVARIAAKQPALRELLETSDPHSLLRRLGHVEGGAELRTALNNWLESHGRRAGAYNEVAEPSWYEDPTTVIELLRGYLDIEDPRAAIGRGAERRESRADEVAAMLPEDQRDRFRALVADASTFLRVKESRNSVMSYSRGSLRLPVMAAARKLIAARAIEREDDIFYLTFDEIEAAGRGDLAGLHESIAERRAEFDLWRNVVPPATIGGARMLPESRDSVKGIAASAGMAQGVARVILSLSEGGRLQPGEILVTRSTTSAWTPLFLTAGAVVTDGGGILSHAAVVAREYRLPAVVAAYTATRQIQDGALITVDGTHGIVTIEPS